MDESSPSGIELPSARSAREFRYILWLGPGFVGSTIAYYLYPPIIGDARSRPFWFMGLFVLAIALPRLWNIVRRRPTDDTSFPAAYAFSSVAYAMVALVFLPNGGLDRFPPSHVRTPVIRKAVLMAKTTKYHITVSSWRPNYTEEIFSVDRDVFRRAAVGKIVTVELHKGFFDVPWYGNISPE